MNGKIGEIQKKRRALAWAEAIAILALVLGAFAMFAAFPARASAQEVTINVMNHICDADIQSVDEFDDVDGPDDDNTTEFHDKLLACPTVVLPGDEYANDAIGQDDHHEFDFTVDDDDGEEQDMDDAEFIQATLCESEIDLDIDGDGDISDDTCLDTSIYRYTDVAGGTVEVTETDPPNGTRPGALEFTPNSIEDNDDDDTLAEDEDEVFGENDHTIELDTDEDGDDDTITLHVFNFVGEDYDDEDDNNDENEDNDNDNDNDDDDELTEDELREILSDVLVSVTGLLQSIEARFF